MPLNQSVRGARNVHTIDDSHESLTAYRSQVLNDTIKIYRAYQRMIPIHDGELAYPKEGPITSTRDVEVLDALLNPSSGKYLLLHSENTVYTLGLWLLYGLPELVLNFECDDSQNISDDPDDLDDLDNVSNPINSVTDFDDLDRVVGLIVVQYVGQNLEHVCQSIHYSDAERSTLTMDRKYDWDDCTVNTGSNSIDLVRVPEEQYITVNTYAVWFYTYYMQADANRNVIVSEEDSKVIDENDGIEYNLYPIYRTTITGALYKSLTSRNADAQGIQSIIDKYIERTYSDFTDSDYDSSTDSDDH